MKGESGKEIYDAFWKERLKNKDFSPTQGPKGVRCINIFPRDLNPDFVNALCSPGKSFGDFLFLDGKMYKIEMEQNRHKLTLIATIEVRALIEDIYAEADF